MMLVIIVILKCAVSARKCRFFWSYSFIRAWYRQKQDGEIWSFEKLRCADAWDITSDFNTWNKSKLRINSLKGNQSLLASITWYTCYQSPLKTQKFQRQWVGTGSFVTLSLSCFFFLSYFSCLRVGGHGFKIVNTSEAYCGAQRACIWISGVLRLALAL